MFSKVNIPHLACRFLYCVKTQNMPVGFAQSQQSLSSCIRLLCRSETGVSKFPTQQTPEFNVFQEESYLPYPLPSLDFKHIIKPKKIIEQNSLPCSQTPSQANGTGITQTIRWSRKLKIKQHTNAKLVRNPNASSHMTVKVPPSSASKACHQAPPQTCSNFLVRVRRV